MDIERHDLARRVRNQRVRIAAASVAVLALVLVLATVLLRPAVPLLDREALWIVSVEQGPMVRSVRGMGRLTPERSRLVTARSGGVVEEILLFPGSTVAADTVILRLSNQKLRQEAANAKFNLDMRRSELANEEVLLKSQYLLMEADLDELDATYQHSQREAVVNERLFDQEMLAETTLEQSRLKVQQQARRLQLERQRLRYQGEAHEAQLNSSRLDIERLEAIKGLLDEQVAGLDVRAGIGGTLQKLPVDVGQQVATGDVLAQVADPRTLKAVIEVPETLARDIRLGQPAVVDIRSGQIPGQVIRIDPTVTQGVVNVDVQLTGEYPPDSRSDMTVEGIIELQRLPDAVFLSRPPGATEKGSGRLYKLESDGRHAVRTSVSFGASSTTHIEVTDGLAAGDQVILSDMRAWDDHDRVRIQ